MTNPYPPSTPRGLVTRWVAWAASSGPLRNPLADTTGRYAHRHQPADVFFLPGGLGGAGQRRISVPAGRALFFPVIGIWAPEAAGLPVLGLADGSAVLDGEALEIATIATPQPFTVAGVLGNPVTGRRGPASLRCWGLWAQTPALSEGEHVLSCQGTDGAKLQVGGDYRLTVK